MFQKAFIDVVISTLLYLAYLLVAPPGLCDLTHCDVTCLLKVSCCHKCAKFACQGAQRLEQLSHKDQQVVEVLIDCLRDVYHCPPCWGYQVVWVSTLRFLKYRGVSGRCHDNRENFDKLFLCKVRSQLRAKQAPTSATTEISVHGTCRAMLSSHFGIASIDSTLWVSEISSE
jgi:hypothetical protein